MKSQRPSEALHEECTTNTTERVSRGGAPQHRMPNMMGRSDGESLQVKLSRSQLIVRNLAEESNSRTADAFSNALVDTAREAAPAAPTTSSGGESSSSFGGVEVMTTRKPHHSSFSNSNNTGRTSGSSDDAGTGENGHVVTVTGASTQTTGTTTTTSSGDDGDFSGACGSGLGSSENTSSPLLFDVAGSNHRHRCHHHRSQRTTMTSDPIPGSQDLNQRPDDGSRLQLVGDNGLDQFGTGPATVVASIIPPPNADANSSSGSGGEREDDCLLQRHREPGYHTIRKTFGRLPKRKGSSYGARKDTSSSEEQMIKNYTRGKHGYPKLSISSDMNGHPSSKIKQGDSRLRRLLSSPSFEDHNEGDGEGSTSGSGTEEGYMGSADSKGNDSSSSPSVSSSEEIRRKKSTKRHRCIKESSRIRTSMVKTENDNAEESGDSSSSEIADFSSGTTSENGDDSGPRRYTIDPFHSTSPSLSSSNDDDGASSEDGYEATYIQARKQILQAPQDVLDATTRKRKALVCSTPAATLRSWSKPQIEAFNDASMFTKSTFHPPIMTLGSDIIAHVLTFLPPPTILDVLTMPLSKEWRQTFTFQPELWRVLCLVEPFKAEINDNHYQDIDDSSSEDSFGFLSGTPEDNRSPLLEKYRLLYTSFVRCMKYLAQIREDALNGKAPSYIDYGVASRNAQNEIVGDNRNLQIFLANARRSQGDLKSEESSSSDEPQQVVTGIVSIVGESNKKRKRTGDRPKKDKKPKIGHSMITDRLLGPSSSGDPGNLHLPWSCAIYSIVNWMVSFSDVEGIQTLCMKVLPFLLENEQQRQTAQRAGLTDIVLRSMLLFPDSVQLHIAAFHTIVLLARPLGGREGMLFHSSMILTGIFCGQNAANPKSGIAVMVDSMKRFEDNDILQAMSCWALVNIALAPAQKAELVKLGGIKATSNAMLRHPFSAEVQFRALFALINMIIPSVHLSNDNRDVLANADQINGASDISEKEIIDKSVGEIAGLVVRAMKNFCSSEAILNRACLVLHNLSLTQEYHSTLLWTPNCYQMLEWCLGNYRTDQVLQQSATGTLHRLQVTLSRDDDLRSKFTEQLRSQQQASLYEAHREALRLHQRQEELSRGRLEPEAS